MSSFLNRTRVQQNSELSVPKLSFARHRSRLWLAVPPIALALSSLVSILTAGCTREKSANAAAADLQKAFQTQAAEPVANQAPAPAGPAPSVSLPGAQPEQAKQLVRQAVVALQSNGYAVAFTSLRAAQTAPNITVDQYDAIEKARLAVEREMAAKAASGDPNAQQNLQLIQGFGH